MDIPRDIPRLWVDVLQQSGVAHVFFEEGAVDGGEGFDGNKEVGSGGEPRGAVFGEATAGDDVMDVGVVLELPAPGMQNTGETREVCPDEALVFGEPFEGRCGGLEQGLVSGALMGAEKRAQGLRDGEGDEKMRSGQLFFEVLMEPLLGFMVLALRAMAIAA